MVMSLVKAIPDRVASMVPVAGSVERQECFFA